MTAEVVTALDEAGVSCILLKGPTIARWLYADGSARPYTDTDLLIGPDDLERGERVLAELGFARRLSDHDTPGWTQAAHHWIRPRDHANVDLHRSLVGVGVSDEVLWQILAAHTEAIELGDAEVATLTPACRALHLALHAAQHGRRGGRHLADLERGVALPCRHLWDEAATLAARLDATAAFATGLRLLPTGAALADQLLLPRQASAGTLLLAGSSVPGALGWNDLAGAQGAGSRASIIARKLVPTPRFMRAWSPLARRGRLGMAAAYLGRPVWVAARLVPGFRAWRRAVRTARSASAR